MKRLATYCIIVLFIVVILLQLNSYLSLIPIPNTPNSSSTTVVTNERYQRDYSTLITYNASLCTTFILLILSRLYGQYRYKQSLGMSLPPSISKIESWSRYEWRVLSSTWSLSKLFQISTLVAFNAYFLFNYTVTTQALEDRSLRQQLLANRSAQLALSNIAVSVLLSAKLSILQRYVFAVHQTLAWHTWFGRLGFMQVLYHATYQLQLNYARQEGNVFATLTTSVRYATGTLMLVAMVILTFGSHPAIRLLSYRLFRWTHISSFFTLICFGCLHHWAFYLFYVTVLLFWVTDQMDRSFVTESCTVDVLLGDIVKLTCRVPYSCTTIIPGQFAFIAFGTTSWIHAWFHSHPFSICSVNTVVGDDMEESESSLMKGGGGGSVLTFYIKANGRDTYRLYQMGQKNREIKARISRPLGRPYITNAGSEFGDYENIVLVAEGMGITPWISVLHYIEEKQHAIKTQTVDILWSIHTIETFYAFEKELIEVLKNIPEVIQLQIQTFITGPSDPEEQYDIPNDLQCIHFSSLRPDYNILLPQIQQQKDKQTVMGICAHEETTVKVNNIGLFYSWQIKTERFEL